jgi:hypothetical protein
LEEIVGVMGWKAIGQKLCENDLLEITLVNPEEEEGEPRQMPLF